jgi:hypothetical protein
MGLAPSKWKFCLELFDDSEVPVPIFSQPLRVETPKPCQKKHGRTSTRLLVYRAKCQQNAQFMGTFLHILYNIGGQVGICLFAETFRIRRSLKFFRFKAGHCLR